MRAARTLATPFGRAARRRSGSRTGCTAVRTHAEAISDADAARMYWASVRRSLETSTPRSAASHRSLYPGLSYAASSALVAASRSLSSASRAIRGASRADSAVEAMPSRARRPMATDRTTSDGTAEPSWSLLMCCEAISGLITPVVAISPNASNTPERSWTPSRAMTATRSTCQPSARDRRISWGRRRAIERVVIALAASIRRSPGMTNFSSSSDTSASSVGAVVAAGFGMVVISSDPPPTRGARPRSYGSPARAGCG
jgi:hypothetical protein